MNLNEIKKSFYKENPKAKFIVADKEGVNYGAMLKDGQKVYFSIPFNDMGGAQFHPEIAAKHLIRWITI